MDKQRRLEWYRLGNTGEPPPSFKAQSSIPKLKKKAKKESKRKEQTNERKNDLERKYERTFIEPVIHLEAKHAYRRRSPDPQASSLEML